MVLDISLKQWEIPKSLIIRNILLCSNNSSTLCLFDKLKYKLITLGLSLIALISIIAFGIYKENLKYETYRSLDVYEIELVGEINVTYFAGTEMGEVIVTQNEAPYTIKLNGYEGAEYEFTITDSQDHDYDFEYSYNKEKKTVELKLVKKEN